MIDRHITEIIKKRFRLARSLYIFGARQVGKTTLIRHAFPDMPYISLEEPDMENLVKEDPRGFLDRYKKTGAILDEVQRTPELFRYLQGYIDNFETKFILSGSQNFLMNQQISQSLAGRISIMEIMPFSQREIWRVNLANDALFQLSEERNGLYERMWAGGYPQPALSSEVADFWFSDYERTYLERDVRLLINVKDLTKFSNFLRIMANRVGSLLNIASISNDLGLSENGCRNWLSILEASGIAYRLLPYHKNYNKRIIKSPKIYFNDTGLLCYLLGIRKPEDLMHHALGGHVFENYIVNEFRKQFINQGSIPSIFFWRDKAGTEIDLLLEQGIELYAIEVKKGKTFTADWLKSIRKWASLSNVDLKNCNLVYGGTTALTSSGVSIWPWFSI